MKLLVVGSEALFLALSDVTKPGVELVTLEQEVDSQRIEGVTAIINKEQFACGIVPMLLANIVDRMTSDSEVKIVVL